MEWIKNNRKIPHAPLVHIRLNTNEHGDPDGDVFYNQLPEAWDWGTLSGVQITHYAIAECS